MDSELTRFCPYIKHTVWLLEENTTLLMMFSDNRIVFGNIQSHQTHHFGDMKGAQFLYNHQTNILGNIWLIQFSKRAQ